ncbi:transposase [Rhodocyclus tenuis]|uniref:Transposase n=1 Tax=Rhodocyclus gracilis TaxID=2929842 RepID=A0ABX0WLQ7_9RHOO|nr:transposase [Rhodocyclus gracilis]NJA89373.1 transposase [Rhodocyclus gracilis]
MNQVSTVQRPRRREYSVEFKASVLEQCRQPGGSLAGIALGHGINPNMVHRWMREERQRQMLIDLQQTASAFVPLQLQASAATGSSSVPNPQRPGEPDAAAETIHIEIQRGDSTVSVHWPLAGAAQCAQVLRELLR